MKGNNIMLIRVLLWFVFLAASPALAIDPECVGKVGPNPTYTGCQWKVTRPATIKFCTPQQDADGDPVPAASLSSCKFSLDGVVQTVNVTEPGKMILFTVSEKGSAHTGDAWCHASDGTEGLHWTAPICFPAGAPRAPIKLD